MRPRDRRQMEQQAKIEAGDPRAMLLATTPPGERSEAAARYDHRLEADTHTVGDYLEMAINNLRRQRRGEAMIRGHESGAINVRLGHLLARIDRGFLPAHIETTITVLTEPIGNTQSPFDMNDPVFIEASRLYGERCEYLKKRYGVERTPAPQPEY